MADTTPGSASQAEATPTAQAATPDAPQDTTPSDSPAESETISLDEAKKLRREAQSLRNRLKAFEEAETQKAQADLSETERERKAREAAEAERDAARNEAQTIRIDAAITRAVNVPSLNARDYTAVEALINRDALTVEDGKVVGVDAELARIKKQHPALFFQTTADGGSGGNQNANGVFDFNAEIRRRAGRG